MTYGSRGKGRAAQPPSQNIIEVYDVGLSADGDPMDLGAACAVMEPALPALAAANPQGIIHRGVVGAPRCPSNSNRQ